MKTKLLKSIALRVATIAMLALVFATTSFADARVMEANWQRGNRGKLNLAAPTQVGGIVLPPGEYEFKVHNTDTGAEIEFARWTYDPYAAEGLPVYSREVVTSVKALPQTAQSASARTGLLLASGDAGKAIGLQIRGDSVDYLF